MSLSTEIVENLPIPDSIIRYGIRSLLEKRLAKENQQQNQIAESLANLQSGQISLASKEANQQHYELPYEFFINVLGPNLKYSGSTFFPGVQTLAEAELDSLAEIATRAQIQNGHRILELGCGWGSLSLYLAKQFPDSLVTAVSNSRIQREFILATAEARGLSNLQVITKDINDLELSETFDRIVSVEMFEHLRNYSMLFKKIAKWLDPQGLLFVHIFCHRKLTYFFDEHREDQWMAKYFFAGGTMPSKKLFYQYDQDLEITEQWDVSGTNYQKTANAWANNIKQNKHLVMPILEQTYGRKSAKLWYRRWLIFFLACAELFGYRDGQEWLVSHYLFKPKQT